MSFFERMMKLHQQDIKNSQQEERQSIYNQQQTAPNAAKVQPQLRQKAISLKSSLSLQLEEQEDEEWQDICDEPSIMQVKTAKRPLLLGHVLPKKQQLFRDMMARKQQFQLKKQQLCHSKRDIQLQARAKEAAKQLEYSRQKTVEPAQMRKTKSPKVKSSSVKGLSSSKPKVLSGLEESAYSVTMQTVCSPVAAYNSFNQEVMLKLLNILEKDRNKVAESPAIQGKKQEKEAPIIINNIMKTPMDTLNKDLMERQMKIRLLQSNRLHRQHLSHLSAHKQLHPSQSRRNEQVQAILTDRTNNRPSMKGFDLTNSRQKHSAKKDEPTSQAKKQSSTKENPVQRPLESQMAFEEEPAKAQVEGSTNSHSNQNSRVEHHTREFKPQQRNKPRESTKSSHNNQENAFININSTTLAHPQAVKNQQVINEPVKPPVRLEIPLEQPSETQGLSLAQAFKKKIGRLKSQQKQQEKVNKKSLKKKEALQSVPSQMAISITDKLSEYNYDFDYSVPVTAKNINISLQGHLSKRAATSAHPSKPSSVRKNTRQDKTSQKKSSEPSKDLIDRLIYGQRAKVSKQDMYALTKKNYNNLPQVVAKKKQQEKLKQQQQRKAKALEYQKAIRSGRSQIKQ